jgi:hypothetical protein
VGHYDNCRDGYCACGQTQDENGKCHSGCDDKVEDAGANSVQIGGDHYRSEYQHWDFVEEHGIGYLEAVAFKYVTRWRKKHGRQDLEKALHYIDKLEEMHKSHHRLPRGIAPSAKRDEFCRLNSLSGHEAAIVGYLSSWSMVEDLQCARKHVLFLLQECDNEV